MTIISILYLQGEKISYLYDSRHSLTRRLSLSTRCLEDFLLAYFNAVQGQTCGPTHLHMSIHHLRCGLCLRMCCVTDFLPTFYKPTSMIMNSDAPLVRSLSPW